MRTQHPSVDVSLPITPMLDMSFQLLAFFILTFRLAAPEGQLAASLPSPAGNPPHEVPPVDENTKDEYTIAVYSAQGDIATMSLRGPASTRADIRSLRELREAVEGLPKPAGVGWAGVTIAVEASDDLAYARLIDVIDLCKKAGCESVTLSTIPKGPLS